jgi:phytoene dehydrogenase-like protein
VVVIGGGLNGLVTAALLARRGLQPLVLERRAVVGGAAVSEEIHPGFRVSSVAYTGALRAPLARKLGIPVETVSVEPRAFAPLPDGRGLTLWGDPLRSAGEIRAFSGRDAERYPAFHRTLRRLAALVSDVLQMTPPDLDAPGAGDLLGLGRLGLRFRGLGRTDAQCLLRWGPMAVADFAQEWFESEPLRALICARGIIGMMAGPWSAGTTANLLLSAAASDGNGAGTCVYVKGGLGSLSEAVAGAARKAGAEIRTGAEVERILTRDGAVSGVALAGGEEIGARAVVSGTDPQRTFLRLLDPALLDPFDVQRLRHYQQSGMCSKLNLALAALPSFRAAQGKDAELLRGRIQIGPEIDELERAFDDAKHGGISRRPYLDVTIPSLADPSLAPAAKHVMSVYVQYTPYRLKRGEWSDRRDELGDLVLRTLEEYAPGLSGLVLARQVLTPLDLEATYGLTRGHPSHGEPSLNQLFTMRPLLGWARYRAPLKGLYLCGAGAHPGGGVDGSTGANAAREILKDLP